MSIFVNAYSTVRAVDTSAGPLSLRSLAEQDPARPFSAAAAQDPDVAQDARDLKQHLRGFIGYVTEQGVDRAGSYTATVHAVRRHINDVRCHYAFERPDAYNAEDLREFREWAARTNSIFFFPDGTVRNAEGVDLLDPSHDGVLPPVTAEAVDRMRSIRGDLWNKGVQVAPSLPPVRSEREVLVRTPAEIFTRASSLSVIGTIAGFVLEDKPVDVEGLRAGSSFAFRDFTGVEEEFTEQVRNAQSGGSPFYPEEIKHTALQLHWGFIAAELLAWTLGLVDVETTELLPADLSILRSALRAKAREDRPEQSLSLRPLAEICDAHERTLSLRWYAVDQELNPDNPSGVPIEPVAASILLERHRAFAWLTDVDARYDDVDLST